MGLFSLFGRAAIGLAEFVGSSCRLLADTVGYIVRGRVSLKRTIGQMASVGTDSIPISLVTLLFVGMIFGLHISRVFVVWGLNGLVGGTVGVAIAREFGPIFIGIVVAARVGSAFAAEIGSMKITEQIDALRALAVSPIVYLVVPRLLACMLMLPVLTVMGDVMGSLGAYPVALGVGVTTTEYLQSTQAFVTLGDLFGGLVKTVAFGVIIAIVGCHQGLVTTGGATGVGRSTTNSVVFSILLIIAANFFLSWLIFAVW